MSELFLPIAVMVFTVVIAVGCVAAARGMMERREKVVDGWLRKSGSH